MTKKNRRLLVSGICLLLILGYAIWYTYYASPEQKEKADQFIELDSSAKKNEQKTATQNQAEQKGQSEKAEKKEQSAAAQTKTQKKSKAKPESTKNISSKAPLTKKSSSSEYSSKECDTGHNENNPLYFGNPSDAITDMNSDTNYLMIKPQYTLSYNAEIFLPNWVAWHLDKDDLGDADRSDDFRPDPELPFGWYAIKKKDYQYKDYGFDRGHICPSADRTKTKEDNSMTFLMTNMVPQTPDNNRVIWMHFENYERELVRQGYEVYLIAGPYGKGGTGAKGTFESIPVQLKNGETIDMVVPSYTWKVLIALPDGTDDISRIDENTICIAINVPNLMGMGKTGDWEQFITTVDEIERFTGFDFFELLPDDVEESIESKTYEYTK